MLPARGADWLVVPSIDAEALAPGRNRVPDVFVTSALERWLATPAASTLYSIYEALGGSRPVGLSGLERRRYEQLLKQRLLDAFTHGLLVAVEVERPVLVPPQWPTPPVPRPDEKPPSEPEWLALELKDEEGKPVPHARYVVTMADGTTREGTLNKNGYARVEGVLPGQGQVSFPELDGQSWS